MRCRGKGPTAGAGSRLAVNAVSIPLFTVRSNSASVISGGACRMLTLASPVGVASSKSGRSASVVGEPVQAETALSANNVKIDEVRMAFTSLFDKMVEQRGLPIELSMQAVHKHMRRPKPRTPKFKSTRARVTWGKALAAGHRNWLVYFCRWFDELRTHVHPHSRRSRNLPTNSRRHSFLAHGIAALRVLKAARSGNRWRTSDPLNGAITELQPANQS